MRFSAKPEKALMHFLAITSLLILCVVIACRKFDRRETQTPNKELEARFFNVLPSVHPYIKAVANSI